MNQSKKKGHNGNIKSKKPAEQAFFNHEQRSERPVVIRRKLTRIDGDVANTGTVLGYFFSSVGVSSCSEWAALASLYEEYRVRGIRVRLTSLLQTTVVSPPTAAAYTAAYPGPIVSSNYASGIGAATLSTAFAADGSRLHGCNAQVMEQIVSWDLNPSAKLWTNTGVALAAISQIGVEFIGSVSALAAINGATTHDAFVEVDVEFRGRQ